MHTPIQQYRTVPTDVQSGTPQTKGIDSQTESIEHATRYDLNRIVSSETSSLFQALRRRWTIRAIVATGQEDITHRWHVGVDDD